MFALENQLARLKKYLPKILSITRKQIVDVIKRYMALPLATATISRPTFTALKERHWRLTGIESARTRLAVLGEK